jgi:hypothetical protein
LQPQTPNYKPQTFSSPGYGLLATGCFALEDRLAHMYGGEDKVPVVAARIRQGKFLDSVPALPP